MQAFGAAVIVVISLRMGLSPNSTSYATHHSQAQARAQTKPDTMSPAAPVALKKINPIKNKEHHSHSHLPVHVHIRFLSPLPRLSVSPELHHHSSILLLNLFHALCTILLLVLFRVIETLPSKPGHPTNEVTTTTKREQRRSLSSIYLLSFLPLPSSPISPVPQFS